MSELTLDDILTPEEAAKFLKMEEKQVLRLAKRGEVPAKKVGRGEWRFKASELSRWFADWTPNTFDPNKRAGKIMAEINGKKKTGI
ncbi:MAG TPA: helix-turn-helix domain-containing protein [Thermodesulfovibrionales bacterium]|nr:helix-turn-helix domain-containing protein [Thermodesulfovibrionales bacterium]